MRALALADMMPVKLPGSEQTFHRDYSTADLAPAGRDSLICRLEDTPPKNADRWKKMPQIANYQVVGDVKPGAVMLMNVTPAGHRPQPLLVTNTMAAGARQSSPLRARGAGRCRSPRKT